jgi:spore coat polysaccharide biosynthesis protein SpsF
MRVVAIIQARMTSRRLPGKVLLPLANKPVLWHIVERLKLSRKIDEIVITTSEDISDDAIENFASENRIALYRGSLNNVLERYYLTAQSFCADAIVRITGDCPLVDHRIVDQIITKFVVGKYDAFSLGGSFPDGLDCQVFSFSAIERAHKEASLDSDREHVGTYIERPSSKNFKTGHFAKFSNLGHHRWTLDEPEDYEFLQEIFNNLYEKNNSFCAENVLSFLDQNKHLLKINNSILRNEGYIRSLASDKDV